MEAESTHNVVIPKATKINIDIYNQSTVVNDGDAALMTRASGQILAEVASAWNLQVAEINVAFIKGPAPTDVSKTSPTQWTFFIIDAPTSPDDQGALAYHTEQSDRFIGYIFAKTILDNGGSVLYASDDNAETVASALFHELAEALIDDTCNAWWQDNNGTLWAAEVADPVENTPLLVVVDGKKVMLSDYILPAWRDTEAPSGTHFDRQGVLTAPFQLAKGGYAVTINSSGQNNTVWGKEYADWKKEHKSNHGRRHRHIRRHNHAADSHKHVEEAHPVNSHKHTIEETDSNGSNKKARIDIDDV